MVLAKSSSESLKRFISTFIHYFSPILVFFVVSLAQKVLDLLDYSDENDIIDYNGDVNAQLYKLVGIDDRNQQHIQDVLGSKE